MPVRLVRSTPGMGKDHDSVQSPELRAVTLLPPLLGAPGHGRQEGRIARGGLDAIVREAGPPAAPEGADQAPAAIMRKRGFSTGASLTQPIPARPCRPPRRLTR
jgi:hypothetical protein